ncbi:TonB-dependent receptor domain-containing protein [Hyphobacterium marinum]|uniref:TonB-dependent receptor n=1 Tax=Hyphobacterium marinum TaxID=3116574 RepID=A0ABU7M1S7_9PROT|nr:TonB-dependent receptor [Hyphobacterium sp. Y6023]MEE2567768.1 TonB-dependent receptor [Hyphobacterium sp. Y6023]
MAGTIIGGLMTAAPVVAQEAEAEADVVYVTGSRIQRTDTVAPSPITNVTAEQLQIVNTVNTEDFINTLPQVVPAFDSTANNPGNGTATVSLRGLGTTRTLVLVDGMRFVGAGVNQVVDLNNIPAAMVQSIDIVTGGASAVYGSDAVAGVVNFILRDDFEGVEMSLSHETSLGDLDGDITTASMVMGGNFDNGRGNAVITMGYTNREAVFQGDRDFSRLTFFDPGPGGTQFIEGGSSNIPGTRFRGATSSNFGLNGAAVNAIDPRCATNTCSGFWMDGGTLRGLRFGTAADPVTDLYNYAPANYLQLPQERYNIGAFASYEVNQHLEFYGRGIYANNVVDSQLAPTPAGVTLTVNLDNPNINPVLRNLMINDAGSNNGDGTATIRTSRRYQELGTRNSLRDTSSFQMVFGARGDINDAWSYDVFANYSRSSVSQIQSGNLSVSALQAGVLCDGGPTAIASGCTAPTVNIFGGENSISAAGAAFISRTGAQIDTIETFQTVATVAGQLDVLTVPMAETAPSVVFGFEYREAEADSRPDSVLGPDVRGFNQSLPVSGVVDVYEFFAEAEVPLVENRPGMESLALNLAFRSSEYNTVGNTETFAIGLGWQVDEQIRLRGNFNRAVRAPNVNDLFAPLTNGFPGAQDPCSGGQFGSFSGATNVQSCINAGVPAGNVGTGFQGNGQMEALFGGNPNLGAETADTYTVGVVATPNIIDGLTIQLDYYNISIEDAITTVPLQTLLNECHISNIASSCAILAGGRNPATGEMGANGFTPSLTAINIGLLEAEGVDLRIDYSFDAGVIGMPGEVGLSYYGGVTMVNDTTNSPTSPVIACAGLYGLDCGEPTPEYKHAMQASWYTGPFTTSLRWRHVGAVDADPTTQGFIGDLSDNIEATNYFDVTFQYDVTENFVTTIGVTNITDTDVPVLGSTASEQANTWPATYDTLGRRLFVGGTIRF